MSTTKQFFPAIYNSETGMYDTTTPYPYAEEFKMYGETWVIHRTPYDTDTPANNWRISHKKWGMCVSNTPCKTKAEAKKMFSEVTTPRSTDISPEEYVNSAVERSKKILYDQLSERRERVERAAKEAKEAQERAEEESSMSDEVKDAVKDYAASLKNRYEGYDYHAMYVMYAFELIDRDSIKRVLINADDLPDHAAELLAGIVDDLIKDGKIECEEKTVSQYYAPRRTVSHVDHGEQEEQIDFADLEKHGVPDTPSARRMIKRIFDREGFTINDTSGPTLYAYYITGNATALLLPDLKTIFNAMQNQD